MTDGHKSSPGNWGRFRKRPREDRALILRAAVLLPLTAIGLRLLGFRRWKKLIERLSLPIPISQPLPAGLQHEMAVRAVRAVRSVELHGFTRPNCLERSLTLWWLLRREGVEGELHIGARKNEWRFEAHAWVELAGQILNDSADVREQYARFDTPIAAAAGVASRSAGKAESN